MSKTVKLRKGLDIRLVGDAEKAIVGSSTYLLRSLRFDHLISMGLNPKMVVKGRRTGERGSGIVLLTSTTKLYSGCFTGKRNSKSYCSRRKKKDP
jgi:hypothetical protein